MGDADEAPDLKCASTQADVATWGMKADGISVCVGVSQSICNVNF